MGHLPLQKALSAICRAERLHICIHDISGILNIPHLSIEKKFAMHSGSFCDLAKSTEAGFNLCMKCKNCCNRLATKNKKSFSGLCAFGLFEAVRPVIIDGRTVCIIYCGNTVTNINSSLNKLRNTCLNIGIPFEQMGDKLIGEYQSTADETAISSVCELIDSYIRLLYEKYKGETSITANSYHWSVSNIKAYVDENYSRPLTLGELCRLYFVNEKYAGKLFSEQVGMTFHEYLNKIRLENAASLLLSENEKIIDIALRCGYGDVTYFNRKFRQRYGTNPGKYRKNGGQ